MRYYLNKYEKNTKIMSITGYSSHINLPKKIIIMIVIYQIDLCLGQKQHGKEFG